MAQITVINGRPMKATYGQIGGNDESLELRHHCRFTLLIVLDFENFKRLVSVELLVRAPLAVT